MKENTPNVDQKLTKKENKEQVVKFVLFSISAGIIEAGSFALMDELLFPSWSYWPKYLIALILSVLWNFTLNREFTFKSANNVPKAMFLVFLFYCVFTPLSTWGGDCLDQAGWNEYVILGLTMACNLSTEFLYDRFVVYRGSMNTNKRGQVSHQKNLELEKEAKDGSK
ncbi:MAG: GtrA family protein [Clostridia bacterium]|nr:GtrA family protein [Clostridia bacterium]